MNLPREYKLVGKTCLFRFSAFLSAENNGLKVEVARIFTTKTPEEILSDIGGKINVPLSVIRRENVSGRDSVSYIDSRIMVKVIGKDGEFFTGASWAIVVTFDGNTQLDTAYRIIDSILVEREGTRKWTLRSLGETSLIAELPFELLLNESRSEPGFTAHYESNFDGLGVSVVDQTADEGTRFSEDKTIKTLIDGQKNAPGVEQFKSSRRKTKLGEKSAEMITMDFRQEIGNTAFTNLLVSREIVLFWRVSRSIRTRKII